MAKLIGAYRLSTLGYDAANLRLVDESGLNNHLPLLAGTPTFSTYSSQPGAFDMTGTAYFGRENLLHPFVHTAILVLHPNLVGGETLNALWASARVYATNDPGHQAPSQPFEDGTNTAAQLFAPFVRIRATDVLFGNLNFNATPASGYTDAAWNVLTYVWNGETSQVKGRFGTGAWGTGAIPQHRQGLALEEMRIGYRPTAITTSGGNGLGALRCDIYEGDYSLDDPAGYAARIDALIANPAL